MNRSRSGKTKNNSLILSFFSFIFSQIGHLARQSVILGFFLNYDALENVCADSKICGKYVDFSRIKAHFLTIKLKCAKYSQESFLINLFEDAACRFFSASLRSFGIFLLSFGGFLVSVNLANGLPRLIHFDFSDTFLFGCILMIISLFMLPVPVKTVITGLRDLFLLPPEEETVQEIKDIVSPILATYGDTKLYYDILRTGRKLWISVYITMNRDMISISKFKSVQKEIIQALSKEYQDFYFELLPDIEYNGDTEVPEPVPDEEEA